MNDRVTIDITDGVADVRLVRADKMNALDDAMFEAIIAAGNRLKEEKGVRVVVLSGEGRGFCAGLDTSNFARTAAAGRETRPAGRLLPRTHGIANNPQYAVWVWREVPVPVIAAVHGVALGGGCQLALGADIRIVAPDTKMSIMEIKWGLVPDMAGTAILRHLLRDDVLRQFHGRRSRRDARPVQADVQVQQHFQRLARAPRRTGEAVDHQSAVGDNHEVAKPRVQARHPLEGHGCDDR